MEENKKTSENYSPSAQEEEKVNPSSSDSLGEENSPPPSEGLSPQRTYLSEKDGTSTSKILRWTLYIGGALILFFYFILFFILLTGSLDNPFFQMLRIESPQLRDLILNFTDIIFFIAFLVFLVLTLVKFFQWIVLEKNAENRRNYLVKFGIYLTLFLFVLGTWILFRYLILRVQVDTAIDNERIILANPEDTIGLTAPVLVDFRLSDRIYESIPRENMLQVSWDFDGDEAIDATGQEVVYRFLNKGKNNGRFPVKARIEYLIPETREEKILEFLREVIISHESVRANVTADQETGPVPLDVQFSANGSVDPDGPIIMYEWDLDGDGQYEIRGENQSSVRHRFEKVGNYPVRLRVTGSKKDMDEAEINIIVGDSDQNLSAHIKSDKGFEGMMPFTVTLDAGLSLSRVGDIISYEWFIEGEEEPFPGRTIRRTFRRPGNYEVHLTVENDLGEKNRISRTITVLDNQIGAEVRMITQPPIDSNGIIRGKAPLKVEFDARSSTVRNPIEWRWDFENDGTVDDFSNFATHTYRQPGEYTVKLEILDALERVFEKTQTVIVQDIGTEAIIKATPSSGNAPLLVRLDGSASYTDDGEIISYLWTLPDQDPFNYDAHLEYEFDSIGTFPVGLRVLTSQGVSDETTAYIVVRAVPLKALFRAVPDRAHPRKIQFDPSESTGTIIDYSWDFGDGNTSRRVSPIHEYEFPGTFKVTLEIRNTKEVVSRYEKEIVIEE